MTIKIPIYRSLGVKGDPEGFSCIPFVDGIWANVFSGNDISLETETYLQSLMSNGRLERGIQERVLQPLCIAGRQQQSRLEFGKIYNRMGRMSCATSRNNHWGTSD